MEEEERLEASLQVYQTQLETVELSLVHTADDSDLLELKSSLKEVIHLTEENLLTLKKQRLLAEINFRFAEESDNSSQGCSDIQKEFQEELRDSSSSKEPKDDPQLLSLISELEGKKCRIAYAQEWGQHSHQNAFIMSVELKPDQGIERLEDVQVRILFCNPFCNAMKMCPYFLDGECRFEEDDCRFSHGYLVKLIDLQEFKDPDYSILAKDCSCLAKYSDGLWYPAVIEECLEDHMFVVRYNRYNESSTVKIEDILPLEQDDSSSEEDDDDFHILSDKSNDSESEEPPSVLWLSINTAQQPLGEWEKHTKGIASKLMEKMGYIWGQGLGKNGDGRLDPIQARVFPQGKSLDKCMELREAGKIKDPLKCKKSKKANKAISARYLAADEKKNVFDFLNNKLGKHKSGQHNPSGSKATSNTKKPNLQPLKEKSNRALNIGSLQLTEEMRRAHRELEHLNTSLVRNKDKDRLMASQIEAKIVSKKEQILQLKRQEKIIQNEQQTRKDHHKLSVF